MSHQRLTLVGTLGAVALAIGCASVLGIEDADCDPTYSNDCAGGIGGGSLGINQTAPGLQPGNGGGGGVSGVSSTAGAGGSAAVASGVGGQGGGASVGSAGAPAGAVAGASGGSSMAAGGVDPVVARASTLCLDYCDTVMAACPPPSQQYASLNACLLVCELLPAGTAGQTSGNNVNCRLGRAELAASTGEAGNYCYTAGPGGGGECGTDCEGYCTLMTAKCREMGTYSQCTSACTIVPDLSLPPTAQFYNVSIQAGDSVQCRLFHVSASTIDPITHCSHAAGLTPCL